MIQNLSFQADNQGMGTLNRVGSTPSGRVIYRIVNQTGEDAGFMSVAEKDCDTFERSYNVIMENAPKVQQYAEAHSSPEEIESRRKKSRWLIGIPALVGGLIPAIAIKGGGWKKTLLQVGATLGGTIAGMIAGFGLVNLTQVPKEMREFSKATKNLSKLDIQPVE